jgi:hypothetical protein
VYFFHFSHNLGSIGLGHFDWQTCLLVLLAVKVELAEERCSYFCIASRARLSVCDYKVSTNFSIAFSFDLYHSVQLSIIVEEQNHVNQLPLSTFNMDPSSSLPLCDFVSFIEV